ncbi:endonuclease/exonuclease/phosphatase family protein [Streptomyces sp. NPDC004610]|uniref:endonuclease/exonuclease/phosphatase family protein n=1 Tax=unclassified Streptomyces TaxID=2593676 RepID=UPI0033AC608A
MRVVSWNLWWRFGPWEARQKAVLATLRELQPDIVGLQEVWDADGEGEEDGGRDRDGGRVNLADWLAGELGLHALYAPSSAPERWQRRIGDPRVGVGVAVLSRWPVIESATLPLAAPADLDDGRLALYARLAAPGHEVPFFTTHLTSAPYGSAVRVGQVSALAGFVAGHRGGTAFPPVVTGDFNAVPDSDEIRLFGGHRTAPPVPGQTFVDAWAYADPAAPWATWDSANPYVALGGLPSTRIDYIHVGPPGPGGLGRVLAVRRGGDGPQDGVWPSDHAAVVADLADLAVQRGS